MSATPRLELDRPRVLPHVLEQHFSELDVLWERRETCVFDARWTLVELAELEQRARHHLAGLRIGRGHALDLAREALRGDSTGAATAAAFVLLNLDRVELHDELIEVLGDPSTPPRIAHGVRIALRHRPSHELALRLTTLARAGSRLARAYAHDVLAFQRFPSHESARDGLGHEDVEVRTLACGAIARWRLPFHRDDVLRAMASGSPRLCRAALETAAHLGLPALDELCRHVGARAEHPVPEALAFLAVVGEPADLPLLTASVRDTFVAHAALEALGGLGCADAISSILDALRDPRLAHVAAQSFLRLTGADAASLRGTYVLAPPIDATEEERAFWDEHLAVDPELAARWWQENRTRFASELRWQHGKNVSSGWSRSFDSFALATRRDLYLRARASGGSDTPDVELERSALAQLSASSA